MRTRNTTDLLFGAKVTSRKGHDPEMTLVVRGTFALHHGGVVTALEGIPQIVQGSLQAETFAEGDDDRTGPCLYPGDFADWKPRAEVLLVGQCHAPGNRLTRSCDVRFAVGAWSKTLRVTGRRVWTEQLLGASTSEPQPFVTMPLGWASAFGGPDIPGNPAGKGAGPGELPTIEDPRALVASRGDRPEPAGFGPINPAWPQRAGKLGKEYGGAYRKTRAPYFAEDFDWSFFNAAPTDQQLAHPLRGDEELAFGNLHPEHKLFTSRLPGLRVRVFVNDTQGSFREVSMVLDTLFADLDAGQVVLTWRGLTPVLQHDLGDVTTVLVACEPLAEPPLPREHYREQLARFEADPLGEDDLSPSMKAALAQARAMEESDAKAAAEPAADPLDALLRKKLAPLAPEERARVRQRIDEAIARAPAGADMRAQILELLSGSKVQPTPPAVLPTAPGGTPRLQLREAVQAVLAAAAKARARVAEGKASPSDLQLVAQAEALAKDPRLQELDPTLREPTSEAPGPDRDLSGQDLSGRDLRGMDLRGARLDGAILTGARLEGARLSGASLKGAVLYLAHLDGADLAGCDLSLCHAANAVFIGASLENADLEQAHFGEAKLQGADLRRTRGRLVSFVGADLSSARMSGARFSQASFEDALLDDADLAETELVRTSFRACRAARVSFRKAHLPATSFIGAALEGASFVRATAEGAIFTKARLLGADLRLAFLRRAHFTEAVADGARFFGADLRDARFDRASLRGTGFARANLMNADLSHADLEQARMVGASLYDAKLLGASLRACDMSGADLERARFEYA